MILHTLSKITSTVFAVVLFSGCSNSNLKATSTESIDGKLRVYHLAGGYTDRQVTITSSDSSVVEVSKGVRVRVRIGEPPGFDNLIRFDHSLERLTENGTEISELGWIGIRRGQEYHYQICDTLYLNDLRWNVKCPLSGSVPGELKILRIKDLSTHVVRFEVKLDQSNIIPISDGLEFVVAASWSPAGFVRYEQHLERHDTSGQMEKITVPRIETQPGASYICEITDSLFSANTKTKL